MIGVLSRLQSLDHLLQHPNFPRTNRYLAWRAKLRGRLSEHTGGTPKVTLCTWAELMRRGLDIDVLECPACGGRLRFVAAILLSSAIRRILRHLGLPSDPVELAPARAPPELDATWAC